MLKNHRSVRFVVAIIAVVAISALAFAAKSSRGFGLFAPDEAAAAPRVGFVEEVRTFLGTGERSPVVLMAPAGAPIMPVSYTGIAYSQDFNGLVSSGTAIPWTNDSTLSGWFLYQSAGTAITAYNAGDGGSSTGSFYSFGTMAATERALGGTASGGAYFGSPASGAIAGWIAFSATNNTGATINSATISFDGEQWRNGGNTSVQTMVLEWGIGNTFGTVGTWTAPGGNFDWASVVNTATAAAVDGNAAGKVASRGGTLSSLGWADGQTDALDPLG